MTVNIFKNTAEADVAEGCIIYHISRHFQVKGKTSDLLFLDFHEIKTTRWVAVWLAALPYSLSSPSVLAGILTRSTQAEHHQSVCQTFGSLFDCFLSRRGKTWCTIVLSSLKRTVTVAKDSLETDYSAKQCFFPPNIIIIIINSKTECISHLFIF